MYAKPGPHRWLALALSGLAAGLFDACFNIGSALGLAILSTVAVSRTDDLLSAAKPVEPLHAVTECFQSALVVAAWFAVLGGLLALLLFHHGCKHRGPRDPRRPSPRSWWMKASPRDPVAAL